MRFSIHYRPVAASILRNLAPEAKTAVRRGIDELIKDPFLGKELGGQLAGFRSHRARRYRIIYRIDETGRLLDVYYVGLRRDVYEAFAELLRG